MVKQKKYHLLVSKRLKQILMLFQLRQTAIRLKKKVKKQKLNWLWKLSELSKSNRSWNWSKMYWNNIKCYFGIAYCEKRKMKIERMEKCHMKSSFFKARIMSVRIKKKMKRRRIFFQILAWKNTNKVQSDMPFFIISMMSHLNS